jgi:hypothetical protein
VLEKKYVEAYPELHQEEDETTSQMSDSPWSSKHSHHCQLQITLVELCVITDRTVYRISVLKVQSVPVYRL